MRTWNKTTQKASEGLVTQSIISWELGKDTTSKKTLSEFSSGSTFLMHRKREINSTYPVAVQSYINYCHDNYFFSNQIMKKKPHFPPGDRRRLIFCYQECKSQPSAGTMKRHLSSKACTHHLRNGSTRKVNLRSNLTLGTHTWIILEFYTYPQIPWLSAWWKKHALCGGRKERKLCV